MEPTGLRVCQASAFEPMNMTSSIHLASSCATCPPVRRAHQCALQQSHRWISE
ncbi:hypothetical protein B0H12DRAFT_287729 [Mycena haematopus]|nr:hypothetical protein B0H12DRAFT_287729 [Mycena haematopus]